MVLLALMFLVLALLIICYFCRKEKRRLDMEMTHNMAMERNRATTSRRSDRQLGRGKPASSPGSHSSSRRSRPIVIVPAKTTSRRIDPSAEAIYSESGQFHPSARSRTKTNGTLNYLEPQIGSRAPSTLPPPPPLGHDDIQVLDTSFSEDDSSFQSDSETSIYGTSTGRRGRSNHGYASHSYSSKKKNGTGRSSSKNRPPPPRPPKSPAVALAASLASPSSVSRNGRGRESSTMGGSTTRDSSMEQQAKKKSRKKKRRGDGELLELNVQQLNDHHHPHSSVPRSRRPLVVADDSQFYIDGEDTLHDVSDDCFIS